MPVSHWQRQKLSIESDPTNPQLQVNWFIDQPNVLFCFFFFWEEANQMNVMVSINNFGQAKQNNQSPFYHHSIGSTEQVLTTTNATIVNKFGSTPWFPTTVCDLKSQRPRSHKICSQWRRHIPSGQLPLWQQQVCFCNTTQVLQSLQTAQSPDIKLKIMSADYNHGLTIQLPNQIRKTKRGIIILTNWNHLRFLLKVGREFNLTTQTNHRTQKAKSTKSPEK